MGQSLGDTAINDTDLYPNLNEIHLPLPSRATAPQQVFLRERVA